MCALYQQVLLALVGQVLRDRALVRVEHDELFYCKEPGKKIHSNGDTQLDDNGKGNSSCLDRSEREEQCQERNLAQGENVHALGKHVLRVGRFGILDGLHGEHHEAAKELVRLETGKTHEQEDTVQDRQRGQRENIQQEERRNNKKVDTRMSEASFLNANDLAVLALLGESIQMHDRVDGGSDKPRQSQHGVHGNHTRNNDTVVVAGFSVGELVRRVIK